MDNGTLVSTILVILGGLVALFFKSKADRAEAKNITSETRIKDAPLAAKQAEIEDEIKDVEDSDDSKLTPDERAKRWQK